MTVGAMAAATLGSRKAMAGTRHGLATAAMAGHMRTRRIASKARGQRRKQMARHRRAPRRTIKRTLGIVEWAVYCRGNGGVRYQEPYAKTARVEVWSLCERQDDRHPQLIPYVRRHNSSRRHSVERSMLATGPKSGPSAEEVFSETKLSEYCRRGLFAAVAKEPTLDAHLRSTGVTH